MATATATAAIEKSLESVAVELNYIATACRSVERAESAGKILARGVTTLSGLQCLKWSSVLEQLVNSVKLVLFNFDLEEQIGRGQIGCQGNENAASVPMPTLTPTVCRQGFELFLAATKVLRGKESFPLFQTLLLKDYPSHFHFLDLLHPCVFSSLSADAYLLLKLVKVLLLNSRTALGRHAEGAPSSSRARPFVSSSQAIGGTLEELGLCLISLYEAPNRAMRSRDPYQQLLISFLEICPLPKLSAGFLERINAFVLRGLARSRSRCHGLDSEEHDFFLALLFEVVKKPSPTARILVRNCLGNDEDGHSNHNLIEESLVTLATCSGGGGTLRPLVDLEILTVLADSYLIEPKMVGMAIRCLEIVMDLLGKLGAATRPRGNHNHPQPPGPRADVTRPTPPPYPYAYDVDKIGKLVRIYNPSRKILENLAVKAKFGGDFEPNLDQFYIFRASLQFMEVLVGKAGKMAAAAAGEDVGDDESELLIQSVLTNYERLLLESKTLVEARTRFIGQGTFDVLAAMSNELYSKLSEESQRHCLLTFLYYADVGREVSLRVKAGRCLAIYLEFDDVAQAEGAFLLQALDVIEKNLTVGQSETPGVVNDEVVTMFGWAFGNFTSVLASYYQGVLVVTATASGEPDGADCDHFLGRLRAIVLTILKNSKGLHNAYRALGNLIYWAPPLYFPTSQFNCFLHEGIGILSAQIGVGRDYKARWNAAAGLGNILRNSALVAGKYEEFVPSILESLSSCMERTESVKEKIHCLNALSKLEHRSYYGAEFGLLWQRLLQLVENPHQDVAMETRSEELMHKIGGACSHLIGVMTAEDFAGMDDFLLEHADSFEQLFGKMRNELQVPEQLETLDSAYQHLQGLQKGSQARATLTRLESFALLARLLDPQQHAHD